MTHHVAARRRVVVWPKSSIKQLDLVKKSRRLVRSTTRADTAAPAMDIESAHSTQRMLHELGTIEYQLIKHATSCGLTVSQTTERVGNMFQRLQLAIQGASGHSDGKPLAKDSTGVMEAMPHHYPTVGDGDTQAI